MIFFYSLLCLFYRRNIFSYFSEKKIIMYFFECSFCQDIFLCSLNSFLFTFFLLWSLPFTLEAFLKCSKISCCLEWGFKMIIVISVCMSRACQLMDFTVQWSGFHCPVPLPTISMCKFSLSQVCFLRKKFSSILYWGIYLHSNVYRCNIERRLKRIIV